MMVRLNDKVWVDPRTVIAVYASTDGVTIKFTDGTTLTVDSNKDLVAQYVEKVMGSAV